MTNWKTLMIFKSSREAEEAQKILKYHGISTILDVIFMTETFESFHLVSCDKLLVDEQNYKSGIQLLKKCGFNQLKEYIDGSYREIDLSENTSEVNSESYL